MKRSFLTDRETTIVGLLTRRFAAMNLQVTTLERSVQVGTAEVLPFTVDDAYSADLPRQE